MKPESQIKQELIIDIPYYILDYKMHFYISIFLGYDNVCNINYIHITSSLIRGQLYRETYVCE